MATPGVSLMQLKRRSHEGLVTHFGRMTSRNRRVTHGSKVQQRNQDARARGEREAWRVSAWEESGRRLIGVWGRMEAPFWLKFCRPTRFVVPDSMVVPIL